jgi:hypothetical protein
MTSPQSILTVVLTITLASTSFAQSRPGPRDGRGPGPGFGPGPGRNRLDQDRERDRPNEPDDTTAGPRPRPMSPREIEEYWEANKQKIIDFCKANSTHRWASIERWMQFNNIRDFKPPRDRLLLQIINLLELERTDPELFKLRVEQIRAEDGEFRYAREYDRALRRGDTEGAANAKEQLRLLAPETIKLRLKERQLRLARLQKRLDQEKQRLAADLQDSTPLVEAHVKEILENPPGPPRRGPNSPPIQTAPATTTSPAPATNPPN